MKVLLIGEYSGVHANLATGVANEFNDTHLVLASNGDRFKDFKRDINLRGLEKGHLVYTATKIFQELKFILNLNENFDVIQIINPDIFSKFLPVHPLFKKLRSKAGKLVLLGAGDDYFYWKAFRENLYRYSPHLAKLSLDFKVNHDNWEKGALRKNNILLLDLVDQIIPLAVEYDIAYRFSEKKKAVHPFPINLHGLEPHWPEMSKKHLHVFHGVQIKREGFKGTNIIREAISLINDDRLIYHESLNLPYAKYINLLKESQVVIDQTNSYSPAINALVSMAQGKVVLGGCEPDFMNAMGLFEHPLINILPNKEHIASELLKLLNDSSLLQDWAKRGRQYVENYHECGQVAKKFMNTWQSV
ncbi:MAG: hypothetical protein FGM41_01510 [Bacteroidetes bacterium]|nr:hypothetical protein [Bacteroidota bacterium]